MRRNTNQEHIEGYVYSHDLVIKTVQNSESANYGKEFISGNVEVAVDDALLNVIPVHFTYVTETTAKGSKNATFSNLKKIIDNDMTVVKVGIQDAQKIKIDTALSLNDFYTQDDRLVSTKVNEGGFVTLINGELAPENERNTFTMDMLITGITSVDADPEKNIEKPYITIKGAVFNFRNELLPTDFKCDNAQGMKFFEDLGVTNAEPVYTKIWGKINCETKTRVVTEESAFGEAAVQTYERKVKEWVVTGTSKVPYDFGDEEVMTAEEVQKAAQDRETKLAEVKARSEEYRAQKAAGTTPVATKPAAGPKPVAKAGGFSF